MPALDIHIDCDEQGRVFYDTVPEHFRIKGFREIAQFIKEPQQRAYFQSHPKMIELYEKVKLDDWTVRYYLPRWWYGDPEKPRDLELVKAWPLAILDTIAGELYDYQFKAVYDIVSGKSGAFAPGFFLCLFPRRGRQAGDRTSAMYVCQAAARSFLRTARRSRRLALSGSPSRNSRWRSATTAKSGWRETVYLWATTTTP